MVKKSFLLSQAYDITANSNESWIYDENLNLNIKIEKGVRIPVCLQPSVITQSKTHAAPGDDDPDPDASICY